MHKETGTKLRYWTYLTVDWGSNVSANNIGDDSGERGHARKGVDLPKGRIVCQPPSRNHKGWPSQTQIVHLYGRRPWTILHS